MATAYKQYAIYGVMGRPQDACAITKTMVAPRYKQLGHQLTHVIRVKMSSFIFAAGNGESSTDSCHLCRVATESIVMTVLNVVKLVSARNIRESDELNNREAFKDELGDGNLTNENDQLQSAEAARCSSGDKNRKDLRSNP